MYQMLKNVRNDYKSPDEHRKELALFFQKEFLDGKASGRSATYKA